MANVLRYYIFIVVLSGVLLSEDNHRIGLCVSAGQSDLAVQMSDLTSEEISSEIATDSYLFSLGYNRLDSRGVRSGFGAEYILRDEIEANDITSSHYKDWFGFGLFSFFQYPIFKYKSINLPTYCL